jgi:methanogenic corrinoid protein MtbC1
MEIKVKEIVFKEGFESSALNSFKLAMLNFDEPLFNQTYNSLISHSSFRTIFTKIFLPFLSEIGVLWMVNSITPAHEHFITNLIKQKLYLNIEKLQLLNMNASTEKYVLFLPLNEIHELGLLYLHFELLFQGKHSIYLGQSVPIENLNDLQNIYKDVCFVTHLTVEPSKTTTEDYLDEVYNKVLKNTTNKLLVTGFKLQQIQENYQVPTQISLFTSPLELLNIL